MRAQIEFQCGSSEDIEVVIGESEALWMLYKAAGGETGSAIEKAAPLHDEAGDRIKGRWIRVRIERDSVCGDHPLRDRGELRVMASEALGEPGRMIAMSKTDYLTKHPDHWVIYNANVCLRDAATDEPMKVWFGDLDLTLDDLVHLRNFARAVGSSVYVLYERDARFETEEAPLLDRAVAVIDASGSVAVGVEVRYVCCDVATRTLRIRRS